MIYNIWYNAVSALRSYLAWFCMCMIHLRLAKFPGSFSPKTYRSRCVGSKFKSEIFLVSQSVCQFPLSVPQRCLCKQQTITGIITILCVIMFSVLLLQKKIIYACINFNPLKTANFQWLFLQYLCQYCTYFCKIKRFYWCLKGTYYIKNKS